MGYSFEDVYKVTLAVRPSTSASYIAYEQGSQGAGEDFMRIIRQLETHPDVQVVGLANEASMPYTYMSNSDTYFQEKDSIYRNAFDFSVTPDYFRVFDIHAADGGSPDELASAIQEGILLSELMAMKCFRSTQVDGRELLILQDDTLRYRVKGVTGAVKREEFSQPPSIVFKEMRERSILRMDEQELGKMQICFRVRPGAAAESASEYAVRFKKEMKHRLATGNFWLANVQYYPDVRTNYLETSMNTSGGKLDIAINIFLLINVFLAVIGTFWFRVNRRRNELGASHGRRFQSPLPATVAYRRRIDDTDHNCRTRLADLCERGLCRPAEYGGDGGDCRPPVACQPADVAVAGRYHHTGYLVSVP